MIEGTRPKTFTGLQTKGAAGQKNPLTAEQEQDYNLSRIEGVENIQERREDFWKMLNFVTHKAGYTKSSQSDIETPIFRHYPPSAAEVTRWLSGQVKKNGYIMEKSDIY